MSNYTEEYNNNLPISKKAKMIQYGKDYIVRKINTNQDIVRLLKFLTDTPLKTGGKTYNGKFFKQNDLNCGLLEDLDDERDNQGNFKQYPNVQARRKSLIPYPFDDSLLLAEQPTIFIDSKSARFDEYDHIRGLYTFDIVITFTPTYNILKPYGHERSLKIADKICEMFDHKFNDDLSQEYMGETMFTVRDMFLAKVGSKGTMARIITIETNPITDANVVNKARAY